MADKVKGLDQVFNPRSVAVVGAKRMNDYMWLRAVSTFDGKVYSVNIDESEVEGIEALGVKNYLSLMDIPEPVDYVIVSVPREVAPIIIRDCIKKKVGGVTLFTSGFAETGTKEGIELQNQLTQMAKEAGLNLVGPNCMGIFNPKIGLRNFMNLYTKEGGPVGYISQSGTHGINFSLLGYAHGIRISKGVSYGNAVVLDSADYLEYLLQDDETKIIAMYIEGVKDGRRLFKLLKEGAKKKPVLIWKGGQTEEGTRATASHTGSLAESPVVWDTLIRQCGAIKVDSIEELVDTTKALLYMSKVSGDGVGLVSMTGGQSVVTTDSFAKAGLRIPTLTEQSYEQLGSFFNIVGGSYKNPIDMGQNWYLQPGSFFRVLDILDQDENIDVVVLELSVNFLERFFQRIPDAENAFFNSLFDFRKKARKAFMTILPVSHLETELATGREKLLEGNIASFPSFASGAMALKNVVDYYRFHSSS